MIAMNSALEASEVAPMPGRPTKRGRKVVFVTDQVPYPLSNGGVIAIDSMVRAIAADNQVTVVVLSKAHCLDSEVKAAADYYGSICASFIYHQSDDLVPSQSLFIKAWHYISGYPRHGFWSQAAEDLLRNVIERTNADVLWCSSTFNAKYLALGRRMKKKTVLATFNVESEIIAQQAEQSAGIRRWRYRLRTFDWRRLEKLGSRSADVVTAITDVDAAHYARMKDKSRVFVLPFGYAAGGVALTNREQEEPSTIAFIGTMIWPPNVAAAHFLVREVMPLVWNAIPEARCIVVGSNPPESVTALASSQVTVTGYVPSIDEYYDRATVITVPVQDISGIKIKLIEALARGKAVVSTAAGTAGLTVAHGNQLMIADSASQFADAIVTLLRDKSERERLGSTGRKFVLADLSLDQTQQRVEEILDYLQSR